jgi:hypothetical protein
VPASSTASGISHSEKGGDTARNENPLDKFVIERVIVE